jgi:hypothetical protein
MPENFEYLKKHVRDWTKEELEHAREHPGLVREELFPAIDARLDAIAANKKLVDERLRAATEKRRLMVSFVDTSSKPANSIDVRSVKHSVQDATMKNGGGHALTAAALIQAYDWLCGHPEIFGPLKALPPVVWLVVVFGGVGWWLILFAQRLSEKWAEEHK